MKKGIAYILLIFALSFAACEQVITIDVPYEGDKLVVNSFFHPDSVITITLSHSQFILENNRFERIDGATAILLNDEGVKLDEMAFIKDGIYKSDVEPKPGKTYRIKVSKNGYETVTAHDKVPADTANILKIEVKPPEDERYDISLSFWLKDPPGDDYYELYMKEKATIYYEDTTRVFKYSLNLTSAEAIFHEFDIDDTDATSGRLLPFEDDLFDGQTIKVTVRTRIGRRGQSNATGKYEHTLYLRKVSESYYRYKKTVAKQNKSDGPFAEPVPVYNNIKNGYGIFAGFNIAVYPVKIEKN